MVDTAPVVSGPKEKVAVALADPPFWVVPDRLAVKPLVVGLLIEMDDR